MLSLIAFLSMTLLFKEKILFEYYVWNLSSESYDKRENNAKNIIKLSTDAVPMLLGKLDNKFIYETDYIIYCLEQITSEKGDYHTTDSAILFWKKWGKDNDYIK